VANRYFAESNRSVALFRRKATEAAAATGAPVEPANAGEGDR
jgi:hypothetical protein